MDIVVKQCVMNDQGKAKTDNTGTENARREHFSGLLKEELIFLLPARRLAKGYKDSIKKPAYYWYKQP